jgi:uncharacterized protein
MHPIQYRSSNELKELVKKERKNLEGVFLWLRKMKPPQVDAIFHSLHEDAFRKFNCLDCANCCSSISPIITEKDIDKLSRHFKMKQASFIDLYLHIDEDADYVFNQSPCPFLMSDNYCSVYESRPKACSEYPHTNRRKMHQILKLTLKNCEICPVVYAIVVEISKKR